MKLTDVEDGVMPVILEMEIGSKRKNEREEVMDLKNPLHCFVLF